MPAVELKYLPDQVYTVKPRVLDNDTTDKL